MFLIDVSDNHDIPCPFPKFGIPSSSPHAQVLINPFEFKKVLMIS